MAIQILDIDKNWDANSTTKEDNWGIFERKLEEWAGNYRNNLYQLGKDMFGDSYEFDNTGNETASEGKVLCDSQTFSGVAVDNAIIGSTTPSTGEFTSLDTTVKKYYSVPACAFIPEDTDTEYLNWENNGSSYVSNTSGSLMYYQAPVYLLPGSLVTRITGYFTIENEDTITEAIVYLYDQSTSSGSSLGTVIVTGPGYVARYNEFDDIEIGSRHVYLRVRMNDGGGDDRFLHGIVIEYE